jgi:hypothetical protein
MRPSVHILFAAITASIFAFAETTPSKLPPHPSSQPPTKRQAPNTGAALDEGTCRIDRIPDGGDADYTCHINEAGITKSTSFSCHLDPKDKTATFPRILQNATYSEAGEKLAGKAGEDDVTVTCDPPAGGSATLGIKAMPGH